MIKLRIIPGLGVFFFIAACSLTTPSVLDQPSITPTLTISALPSHLTDTNQFPSATPRLIPAHVAPSDTAQPISETRTAERSLSETQTVTANPTIPVNIEPRERCLDILPTIPPDADVKGVIVLWDYFLDLKSGRMTPITNDPDTNILIPSVSPDQRRLAYTQEKTNDPGFNPDQLVIATLDEIIQIIPWKEDWEDWSGLGWLGNDLLIFTRIREPYRSKIVFDPSDQSWQELLLEDPQLLMVTAPNLTVDSPRDTFIIDEYDPTLTRVIYLGYNKGNSSILKDLQTGDILAVVPNHFEDSMVLGFDASMPSWEPDYQSFLIEGGSGDIRDLYRVTRDGQVTRLTYLSNVFGYSRVRGYSRSEDQRYIAFWYWGKPNKNYHLAKLDIATGVITDLCIRDVSEYPLARPNTPIWSPEGHQFVVEIPRVVDEIVVNETLLVDADQGYAVVVGQDMSPLGWMIAP